MVAGSVIDAGVHVHPDADAVEPREQGDVDGRSGGRPERVLPQDLCPRQVEGDRRARHVGGDDVDATQHPAEHPGRHRCRQPVEQAREWFGQGQGTAQPAER